MCEEKYDHDVNDPLQNISKKQAETLDYHHT